LAPISFMWTLQAFSVHGQYEEDDCQKAIEIALGHPKDGRRDLKQFVLSMVTN
jgi:transposase